MNRILLPQTQTEFINILIDVAELGAKRALVETGLLKPFLKLREAQRLYGAAVVNRWIKEGLITPIKDGDHSASLRIDRQKLDVIAKVANRSSYLTTEERKL